MVGEWRIPQDPALGLWPHEMRRGYRNDARYRWEHQMTTAPLTLPSHAPHKSVRLSTITHELRAPLASLQVTVELLDEFDSLTPNEVRRLVAGLQHNVSWMTGLVDNLTSYSLLEPGWVDRQHQPIAMLDVIELALGVVQPLLNRKHQQVHLICATPAPLVAGDVQRLGQVLVNLLANAGTYGPEGDVIDLSVALDEQVTVAVADHGPGIPPADQARIFAPFTRGSRHMRANGRGLGLGLFIVKAIVEAHCGRVGVDSTPGQGSSFWFRLPRFHDHDRAPFPEVSCENPPR